MPRNPESRIACPSCGKGIRIGTLYRVRCSGCADTFKVVQHTRLEPVSGAQAGIKKKTALRRTRLAQRSSSASRKERDRIYYRNKNLFMEEHQMCQCGCGRQARDLHHKAGRSGENYTDPTTFMAVCRTCHDWIHANPSKARERGWLV